MYSPVSKILNCRLSVDKKVNTLTAFSPSVFAEVFNGNSFSHFINEAVVIITCDLDCFGNTPVGFLNF